MPDIEKDYKARMKTATLNQFVASDIGCDPRYINFNQDMERLTLVIDDTRVVLQGIDNYAMKDMEKVIKTFGKERIDLILLCLPQPNDQDGMSLMTNHEEVREELGKYLK